MQLQVETAIYKDGAIGHGITDAGTKATHYITWFNKQRGMQIHDKATLGTEYNNYIQINSYDISMWRGREERMRLDENTLRFFSYDSNQRQRTLASYGNGLILYKPQIDGVDKPVVIINQDGATFEGTINAIDGNLSNSVTIGGKEQSDYLNSNVQIGNLLRLTPRLYEKNEYLGYQLNLTENLIGGETYTLQFWGLTLDNNSEGIELFWGGNVIPLTSEPLLPDENGYLSYTFKVTSVTSNNAWINVYNVPEEAHNDKNISIVRWKLEKGSVAKAWALAAEDMESTYSCVCETAVAEPQKIANCDNFILNVGTVVAVKFINGNNCASAMKLNVSSTGFKKVLMVGEIEASSSEIYRYNLSNNTTVTFVYDGENWRITGDNQLPAQITHIDNGGISIHPVGDINQRLNITADGIDIRKDDKSIAFYGQNARIGRNEDGYYHTTIDTNGMSIWSGKEETDATGVKKLASYSGSSIKFYQQGNLKGDFSGDTITLYGGNTTAGTYPKVEINGSAITIAKSNEYKTLINDSGLQIHVGNSTNSIASFSSTVRIGNSGKERVEITNSSLEIFDGDGHRRVYVDKSSGIILGWSNDTTNRGYVQVTDAGLTIYDNNKTKALETTTDGVVLYKGGVKRVGLTTKGMDIFGENGSTTIASFGSTVLLGQSNQYQLSIDASKVKFLNKGTEIGSIQAINGFFDILGPNVGIASSASNGSSVYCTSEDVYIQSTDEIQLNTETLHIYASTPSHYPNGLTLISHDVDCENSLQVEGTFYNGSDKKIKDNISSINFAEELIMSLKPVTYMFKKGKHMRKHMGLIAQEVAATCIDLQENLSLVRAQYNEKTTGEYSGEHVDDNLLKWSLAYQELIAPMIQVIQSQNKQLKEQHKEIEQLKKEVAELKK